MFFNELPRPIVFRAVKTIIRLFELLTWIEILAVSGDEGFLLGSVDAYGRLVVTSLNSDIQGTVIERMFFFFYFSPSWLWFLCPSLQIQ